MSNPNGVAATLTPDDHKDDSRWYSFFDAEVRYFNNVLINKMIDDLHDELNDRANGEHDASN